MATIKVLTFNIQFGQPWITKIQAPPVNIEGAIEELKRHEVDFILLQEVEKVELEKGQINPPPNFTRIKDSLPEFDAYFNYPRANDHELPFGFGLAILSKTELFGTVSIDLPAPDIKFSFHGKMTSPTDRLIIGAKTSCFGKDIQLFNTHLQSYFMIGYSADDYPQQCEIVTNQLKDSKLPTVIGGDFNVAPGESTVERIESLGYHTSQDEAITWKRMSYITDHIFYNEKIKLVSSNVSITKASDHNVLIAELEI